MSDFNARYASAIAKKEDRSQEIASLEESRDRWKSRAEDLQEQIDAWIDAPPEELTKAREEIDKLKQSLGASEARVRGVQELEREIKRLRADLAAAEAPRIQYKAECEGHRKARADLLEYITDLPDDAAKAIRRIIL